MADPLTEYTLWLNQVITIVTGIAITFGLFISIRKYRRDRKQDNIDQKANLDSSLKESEKRIKEVVTLHVKNIDQKIENIESTIKTADGTAKDLKTAVDTLGKDLNEVQKKVLLMEVQVPEIKTLKDAFYKLKSNVDTYMAISKAGKMFNQLDEDNK